MFAELPYGFFQTQHNLAATPAISTSAGTTISARASVHVMGTWASFIASTNFDVQWAVIMVMGTGSANTQTDTLLDVGIGTAGSEVVIINTLPVGWRAGANYQGTCISAPLFIPKGTRVAARAQSITSNKTMRIAAWLYGGCPNPSFSQCYGIDAYGINAAASQGTSHTPGNSGAYSSWANIGSTTTKAYKGMIVIPQGTMSDTNQASNAYYWEGGIGSTTYGKWAYESTSSEQAAGPVPIPGTFTWAPIPIGAQLQVRATASGTAEPHDVAVYCIY